MVCLGPYSGQRTSVKYAEASWNYKCGGVVHLKSPAFVFVLFCFCFVLFCFVLFCFVLFCFVLFCFVLFCFVLFCFVLFCFVLFCFVFLFFIDSHIYHSQWWMDLIVSNMKQMTMGKRLVNLCQEYKLRPAQTRFPQPRNRLWTWMHPGGPTHQLDHILINNKWINSLRNCMVYNTVEQDSDHRILRILLSISFRTSEGKLCKKPKFDWKKLQDADTKHKFQIELTNRFKEL